MKHIKHRLLAALFASAWITALALTSGAPRPPWSDVNLKDGIVPVDWS